MRWRYLLIDNDNTLMDFGAAERKALADALENAGIPADAKNCETYHRINDGLWKALERGETTQPQLKVERFRQLLAYLGRSDAAPETLAASYAEKLGQHADLLPGAEDFIRNIHGKMKIALVSNGVSSIQRSRLKKCPLTALLDEIVISEEVGAAKPDPKLLHAALERLGCEDKSLAVMMGDSATADIPAATNAGIDSIFFSPQGETCAEATYSVTNYGDALAILLQE